MKRMRFSVLVVVAILGGCSSDSTSTPLTSTPPTSTPLSPPSTTTSTMAPTSTTVAGTTTTPTLPTTPTTSAAPTEPPEPATSTGPPTSAGTPPVVDHCATDALQLTVGETEGAMGNQYTPIVFTNVGDATCTLDGHPGVSFVDSAGRQVGDSAARVPGPTPTVTLAAGERAHATLDYHDPGFFDHCAPAPTAGLKVYPPDDTTAITIPFPSTLCTAPIPQAELTIESVSPGDHIITAPAG